jgi:two-component system, OmpR family, phosphate regulon sensor histidine kinase PhoR
LLRTRLLLTCLGIAVLSVAAATRLGWAGTALAIAVALIAGLVLSVTIARRVEEQAAAASRIAEGDLAARAPAMADDEIGRLGRSLNLVAERQAVQIETLTINRDELETVLDSVADGLIAIDSADVVTHLNPEARRMFDVSRDVVGRPFWEITRDAALSDLVAQVKRDGRPAEGSLIGHTVPRRDLEARVSPKAGPNEAWRGAVLVFRDVTRLHRLEAVRRDFVANVSHEMKTPLTSIQGYVETLLSGALDDPAVARDFLAKIERNSKNLGHLVTDLLVLSRVEAGGIQVDPDPFPLFSVVSEAAAACADKAREKGLEFQVVPGSREVVIRGDRDLLVRALVNLLDNAIQYTPSGGRVAVKLNRAETRADVTVADTGIGIPAGDLERVFERFYRVDRARSRALGGTGLGLAIVKHVAERHGGSIRVVSVEGKGSSFTLSLPLSPAA